MNTQPPHYQIAAYFPEWEFRRPYYVKHLEASGSADKITLINYAFGFPGPDPKTGAMLAQLRDPSAAYQHVYSTEMSVDGAPDLPDQPLRGHFNQLRKLKARHPHLKVVISLGGWTDSTWFSPAARTEESRQRFVASCIDLYIHGNLPEQNGAGGLGAGAGVFDGIDIDWEYPIKSGLPQNEYHPTDDENFVLLLQEFRRQFTAIGRPDLLLTAAVPGPAQAGQYQMQKAHPYLDYVALMTYDLYNGGTPSSGHHTSLFNSDQEPVSEGDRLSADRTVKVYRDTLGVPPEKILLGAAFYGRAWKVVSGEREGLYQPGQPVGYAEGETNYRNLPKFIEQGFARHWDDQAKAPWLFHPDQKIFISYDDPESVALKAQYIQEHGLGGVMFWEISADDDAGTLTNTLYEGLQSSVPAGDR